MLEVRVIATWRASPPCAVAGFTYHAEACADNPRGLARALWCCEHDHDTPVDAYACGRDYALTRAARTGLLDGGELARTA